MSDETLDEIDQAGVDSLVASINIPPRPDLLRELQVEISKRHPDPRVIAAITAQDIALSAAVIKVVNSPFYGLGEPVRSLNEAVLFLGLLKIAALVTGLVLRKALRSEGPNMSHFWEASTKRAAAMQHLSLRLRIGNPDIAQTFGLFCDIGVPLLLAKFPDYLTTLALASKLTSLTFTEVEQARHGTDHALAGAVMAKTWGLSPSTVKAIRLHHDYEQLVSPTVELEVRELIALGTVADKLSQVDTKKSHTAEWEKGGEAALKLLTISDTQFEKLKVTMKPIFDGPRPQIV